MPKTSKAAAPYRQLRNTNNILSLYEISGRTPDIEPVQSELPLSDQLSDQPDVLLLDLENIEVDPNRVRKYFDPQALASLATSIQTHGFVGAVVVRLNSGWPQYTLVAGGRRYAAAKLAGLKTIRAIVAQINEEQALEFELIENLQRQDLNPIEETQGILQLLSKRLQLEESEVVALFQRHAYFQQNQMSDFDPNFQQQWQTVEQLFNVIGKFTPSSFRVNRLPLLNLPAPIFTAVQAGQLEYSKARLIARIKDQSVQSKLLQQTLDQGLSQAQIQETIKDLNQNLKQSFTPSASTQTDQIQIRAANLAKTLKRPKCLTVLSTRDRDKVEKLLDQLWEIIAKE